MRYHLYVQWLAHERLSSLAAAKQAGCSLCLDLPLGTNPDGYDVWRQRSLFALDVNGGAPPDSFFTKGQNWGFPPLHPQTLREQGCRYFIASIQNHLRYAGVLRIDHATGLHRLFWIPKDFSAPEGVYVHYRTEELYAILALESYRHQALLVGEDLGTVPRYVRPALARHKAQRMYALPFELSPDPKRTLRAAPTDSLACMSTHDMPTFTSFWRGLDIQDRVELGLMDQAQARREWSRLQKLKATLLVFLQPNGYLGKGRSGTSQVLTACLKFLGSSRAGLARISHQGIEKRLSLRG